MTMRLERWDEGLFASPGPDEARARHDRSSSWSRSSSTSTFRPVEGAGGERSSQPRGDGRVQRRRVSSRTDGVDEALAASAERRPRLRHRPRFQGPAFASFNDGVADQYDYRRIPMVQREEETGVLRRAEPKALGGFSPTALSDDSQCALQRPSDRPGVPGSLLDRLNAQIAASRATVALVSLISTSSAYRRRRATA